MDEIPEFVQVNSTTWVRPDAVELIQESETGEGIDQVIVTLTSGTKVVCNCNAEELITALTDPAYHAIEG